jgi:hypothetical protein
MWAWHWIWIISASLVGDEGTMWPFAVLGKILSQCISNTDTDTTIEMYLRYRYKIPSAKCI